MVTTITFNKVYKLPMCLQGGVQSFIYLEGLGFEVVRVVIGFRVNGLL